jgi:hypothetical protein
MNNNLPNEILNIIFSYRGSHPIVKNTGLVCLIALYNEWNDSEDKTYVSFGYFTSRALYEHGYVSRKDIILSLSINEDSIFLRDNTSLK